MITKFKLYEDYIISNNGDKRHIKVGDYVLVTINTIYSISKILNNNIGRVIKKNRKHDEYLISYKDAYIPDIYINFFNVYYGGKKYEKSLILDIIEDKNLINKITFSKNKKDLEILINVDKYNL